MKRTMLTAAILISLGAGSGGAQYARPIEVVPARPVGPGPTVVNPNPGVGVVAPAPAPLAPAPTITNPPTAVVPSPPPAVAQGAKVRPRKCWCYLVNPATNARQRSTCEIDCCKGSKQDERC